MPELRSALPYPKAKKSSMSCCGLITAALLVTVVGFFLFVATLPRGKNPANGERPAQTDKPNIGGEITNRFGHRLRAGNRVKIVHSDPSVQPSVFTPRDCKES